jgi:hypothetical protein
VTTPVPDRAAIAAADIAAHTPREGFCSCYPDQVMPDCGIEAHRIAANPFKARNEIAQLTAQRDEAVRDFLALIEIFNNRPDLLVPGADLTLLDGAIITGRRIVDEINAEVTRLAAELEELRAEGKKLEANAMSVSMAADAYRAKVHAIERVHVWTNEDGTRFLLADDVAQALGLPS